MAPGTLEDAQEELARARQALREARTLLDANLVNGAVSRLYYAAFHAARGALTVRGLYAKTHSGNATLFRATFGPHQALDNALQLRQQADYGAGVTKPIEELRALDADVEAFVVTCESIVAAAAERGPDEPDPPADL